MNFNCGRKSALGARQLINASLDIASTTNGKTCEHLWPALEQRRSHPRCPKALQVVVKKFVWYCATLIYSSVEAALELVGNIPCHTTSATCQYISVIENSSPRLLGIKPLESIALLEYGSIHSVSVFFHCLFRVYAVQCIFSLIKSAAIRTILC
jgi:hypothetical protein